MSKKDLREERTAEIAETYEREALLLEKAIRHMKHEMRLLEARDYAALCDSVVGRGEHIDDIAKLEARRREMEAELSGISSPGRAAGPAAAPHEALADPRVDEARRKAATMHRQALELDSELRDLARAHRTEMETKLAGLAHGRVASRAYNGHGRAKSAAVFVDKER
ncbi:MAG: flagellar export chaperone FlgN [Bacillota bacterium]|nr:flagellar export chaperone FlgN [Bacillota bacterium]